MPSSKTFSTSISSPYMSLITFLTWLSVKPCTASITIPSTSSPVTTPLRTPSTTSTVCAVVKPVTFAISSIALEAAVPVSSPA